MLIESSLEKDVKFAGIVRDLPVGVDPTSRTELIQIIDQGKRDRRLAWSTSPELRASLYLNIHHVKICSKADKEDILLRIPIHQIAAVSYIPDDDLHIMAIMFGELDMQKRRRSDTETQCCHLAVLYCDSRGSAEQLCTVVDQCFQVVYTDATMHFFDKNLMEGASQPGGLDYTTARNIFMDYDKSGNSTPKTGDRNSTANLTLGFLSHSSISLGNASIHHNSSNTLSSASGRSRSPSGSGPRSGSRSVSTPRKISGATVSSAGGGKEGELSDAANQLILDYMNKLYTKLSTDELQKFALLVKAWHADMSFQDFCYGVSDLYGPERTHLLVGMRPFIPAKDSLYFERFIEKNGFQNLSTSDEPAALGRNSRIPASAILTFGGQTGPGEDDDDDDYDVMLNNISHGIEQLSTDVDSP